MSKLVITTVGTSLLEKKGLEDVKGWVSNKLPGEIDSLLVGASSGQKEYDKRVQGYLSQVSKSKLENFSAEIASLDLMPLEKENDRVVLLYSDTPAGAFCARANAKYIDHNFAKCELGNGSDKDVRKINGLETEQASAFLQGLNHLVTLLQHFERKANNEGRQQFFNVTGGFKGTVPLISFYARKKQISIVYYYEKGNELIEIPPDLDLSAIDPEGNVTSRLQLTGLEHGTD